MGNGGKILIVAGSILQVPAVEAARELGLSPVVTDRDPDCACAPLADEFYPLDIFDVPAHVKLARGLGDLRAVFTCACDATVTVATVAREADLHGLPVEVTETCRNKVLTRVALNGKAPQPRYWLAAKAETAREAVREFGPSIIKATGGSGGRGHTRVGSEDELTDEAFGCALAQSLGNNVLIEEMLYGLELSVETLWYDGQMYPLNAVERPFAHRPWELTRYTSLRPYSYIERFGVTEEVAKKYVIELGHFNPAMLGRTRWKQVWEVMEAAGHAVGIGEASGGHIFKGDLIMTDDEIKVLELTPRLSGNFDSGRTSPLAHGVDYIKAAMRVALGQIPGWRGFAPRWYRHAVCLSKFAEPGVVREIRGLDAARRKAEVIVKRGVGSVVPKLTYYAAQVAYVVADGRLRSEAMGRAMRALEVLEWVTE